MQLPPSSNPQFAIVNLLAEVCDTLLDPWDPRSRDSTYHDQIQALGVKLKQISLNADLTKSEADPSLALDLYQVATRVYLTRASQSTSEQAAELDAFIDDAFNGPLKNCTCEHFFPLLILSCEAQRDEQRAIVLNLLDRTERVTRSRSVKVVRKAIQLIWVQQDLNADSEMLPNYSGIMSAALSSCTTIPSFA